MVKCTHREVGDGMMVEWLKKNCLILLLDNSTIVTRDGWGGRRILELPTGDGEGTGPARDDNGAEE